MSRTCAYCLLVIIMMACIGGIIEVLKLLAQLR